MTIDPDVRAIGANWANSQDFAKLLQAVNDAEGNILAAVQKSIPSIVTRDQALKVVARSATHALLDYVVSRGEFDAFVEFWAARWAPVGAANDPKGLNKFWSTNVKKLWNL